MGSQVFLKFDEIDSRVSDIFLDFIVVCVDVDVTKISVNCEISSFEAYLSSGNLTSDEDR